MRKQRWIALLAVLGVMLAACGGDDATDEPADDTGTEEPADDATDEDAADDADDAADDGEAVALRWRTRPDNQQEIDVYSSISTQIDDAWDVATLEYEPGGSETSSYQD